MPTDCFPLLRTAISFAGVHGQEEATGADAAVEGQQGFAELLYFLGSDHIRNCQRGSGVTVIGCRSRSDLGECQGIAGRQ